MDNTADTEVALHPLDGREGRDWGFYGGTSSHGNKNHK